MYHYDNYTAVMVETNLYKFKKKIPFCLFHSHLRRRATTNAGQTAGHSGTRGRHCCLALCCKWPRSTETTTENNLAAQWYHHWHDV